MPATKTIEVDREKVISILNIALSKDPGNEIFIPCASVKEQKDMHICIIRELKVMSEIDPDDAASIVHRKLFRDGRFWVVLTRIEPTLSAVYVKDSDGKLSKVKI